ncbi:MAPEG family protein [Ruegeria conchae]|uniref:Putative MAPEG superfamily protein n=1 Tax=Ruegeria conchae TaxID=981384 RepID=A0A497ZZA9_9RHOB|nr:MAPEG family protein [Ruegeria conchae]RLK08347.1 putative MAPEG superfamily protein [Ruegeria conchae]UWR01781.1 MAPEG family protein [Ruegeria conchae]
MEAYAEYSHAIASLVIFTLIVLFMSPFSALAKAGKGLAPGATPDQDYSDKAYRLNRAYLNGTETLPAFLTVTVAAILLGVSPFWVNLLASVALLARVVMLVIHLRGIGKPHSGVRSVSYVVGWACMAVLGLMALVAAF